MSACRKVCGSPSRSSPPWSSLLRWSWAWCVTAGGGSACRPARRARHARPIRVATPRRRASRSARQNRRRSDRHQRACPPSATTRPFRATRRGARSPMFSCPNPSAGTRDARRAAHPAAPAARGGTGAGDRGHRTARWPAGTAARPAGQIAERARAQHAGPARRRRSRRGLLAGRRGHPAGRRPGPGGHRLGGRRSCAAGWPAATCAPRPTRGRCCARC